MNDFGWAAIRFIIPFAIVIFVLILIDWLIRLRYRDLKSNSIKRDLHREADRQKYKAEVE